MQFYLAVKGIIRKEDEILILKRNAQDEHAPNVWETPGGGVDEKILPQEALLKEVEEETGLKIKVGEPFNVFTFVKDSGEYKAGITFLCEYISGEVVLSDEHSDFRWIKPEDFKNFPSIPSLYQEIARYAKK